MQNTYPCLWNCPSSQPIAYSIAAVMMPKMVSHFLKGGNRPSSELWLTSIEKVTVIVLPL
ncbi:MAG: hypothetical protein R2788_11590 [Saprospiraceae bacterium]